MEYCAFTHKGYHLRRNENLCSMHFTLPSGKRSSVCIEDNSLREKVEVWRGPAGWVETFPMEWPPALSVGLPDRTNIDEQKSLSSENSFFLFLCLLSFPRDGRWWVSKARWGCAKCLTVATCLVCRSLVSRMSSVACRSPLKEKTPWWDDEKGAKWSSDHCWPNTDEFCHSRAKRTGQTCILSILTHGCVCVGGNTIKFCSGLLLANNV